MCDCILVSSEFEFLGRGSVECLSCDCEFVSDHLMYDNDMSHDAFVHQAWQLGNFANDSDRI